jgi:hypothetical protein
VTFLEQGGLARGASGRNHGFLWLHLLVAQAVSGPMILGETAERVGYRPDVTPPGLWTVAQRSRRLFPFLERVPIVRT